MKIIIKLTLINWLLSIMLIFSIAFTAVLWFENVKLKKDKIELMEIISESATLDLRDVNGNKIFDRSK